MVVYRAEEGKPVGGVLAETATTQYGDLSLELPAGSQGTFFIRLSKKGYADIERVIELLADESPPFVDALAVGARRLEGRVKRSSDEAPIAQAEVTVSDGFGTWKGWSDQAGRFVVAGIPPKTVTVKVEAEGYATAKQELPGMLQVEPIEIWLEPGWSAVVQIVDALGTPIPEVARREGQELGG